MLIDSHCHIDFEEFDADRAAVLSRALNVAVTELIVPAVSQATWSRTIQVCSEHELHLALGLHPMFTEQHQPQHLVELDMLCSSNDPVAVGEIGLDFYSANADKEKQLAYFAKQLIIAKQHKLPVIVHCRKAHDECIRKLNETGVKGGIIHAFNGSIQQARKYIERGFLLGFGGMLTFERSRKLRALIKEIPLTAIALETDAPDMTVKQHKGQRNSPEYLPFVAKSVADLKGLTPLQVAKTTTENIRQLLLQDQA